MSTKELLNKNFQAIQTQIQEATSSAERPADSVKLVAVPKRSLQIQCVTCSL